MSSIGPLSISPPPTSAASAGASNQLQLGQPKAQADQFQPFGSPYSPFDPYGGVGYSPYDPFGGLGSYSPFDPYGFQQPAFNPFEPAFLGPPAQSPVAAIQRVIQMMSAMLQMMRMLSAQSQYSPYGFQSPYLPTYPTQPTFPTQPTLPGTVPQPQPLPGQTPPLDAAALQRIKDALTQGLASGLQAVDAATASTVRSLGVQVGTITMPLRLMGGTSTQDVPILSYQGQYYARVTEAGPVDAPVEKIYPVQLPAV